MTDDLLDKYIAVIDATPPHLEGATICMNPFELYGMLVNTIFAGRTFIDLKATAEIYETVRSGEVCWFFGRPVRASYLIPKGKWARMQGWYFYEINEWNPPQSPIYFAEMGMI